MGLVGVGNAHGSPETAISLEMTTIVPPRAPASIPRPRTYIEIELLLACHEHAYQAFDCNTQGEGYTLGCCVQGWIWWCKVVGAAFTGSSKGVCHSTQHRDRLAAGRESLEYAYGEHIDRWMGSGSLHCTDLIGDHGIG